jgi:hypothetical protein
MSRIPNTATRFWFFAVSGFLIYIYRIGTGTLLLDKKMIKFAVDNFFAIGDFQSPGDAYSPLDIKCSSLKH